MRRRQLHTPERPDINSDSSEKTKEHRSPKRRSIIILWGSILLNAIFLTRMAHTRYNRTNLRKQSTKKTTRLSLNHLNDESIVPLPRDSGRVLNLEERLRYLEMKFAARISFGIRDPFVGSDENLLESESQGSYSLEVKTMNTIRKELGHEDRTIDYLKIDVEGSEFAFMEEMLDTNAGCPAFINQMGIEWHHFSVDSRYGEGSSGQVNAIVTFLKSCGFELYW